MVETSDVVLIGATVITTIVVGLVVLIILDKRFKKLIPFMENLNMFQNPPTLSGVAKGTRFRKTLGKDGKPTRVAEGNYLYLGRTVNDRGPEGYSHVSEIRDTLRIMNKEHRKGIIDSRTLNARQMRLKGIVEQTDLGELEQKGKKVEAVRAINEQRRSLGWKTLSYDMGPKRPTKKQREASEKNIKIANQKRIADAKIRQQKKIEEHNRKMR